MQMGKPHFIWDTGHHQGTHEKCQVRICFLQPDLPCTQHHHQNWRHYPNHKSSPLKSKHKHLYCTQQCLLKTPLPCSFCTATRCHTKIKNVPPHHMHPTLHPPQCTPPPTLPHPPNPPFKWHSSIPCSQNLTLRLLISISGPQAKSWQNHKQ